jgi:hypothetical protein
MGIHPVIGYPHQRADRRRPGGVATYLTGGSPGISLAALVIYSLLIPTFARSPRAPSNRSTAT